MLPGGSSVLFEDGDDQLVAVPLADLRKGTVDCVITRAPLDAILYQGNEDGEALLLGQSVGSGVVGNGGTRGMPAS
jgi:hypothetical protein